MRVLLVSSRVMVQCSCCGQNRPVERVGAFACHPETVICRECINWLHHQAGMIETTPTLPVIDMAATISFYESAGFDVHAYNDGFAFVQFEDVSVFDLDHNPTIDPARNGAGCFLIVPDSDAWHERLTSLNLRVTAIDDMPWGMREFALTDPNGNRVRIATST